MTATIYTDGACSGNPGPGGWGAIIIPPGGEKTELCGGDRLTTNNRMELTAVIEGLSRVPEGSDARVVTDSTYVRDGITGWIERWKKNGWRTTDKKPVKNQDLWTRLDLLASARRVEWKWVKGHAGNPMNELADELARRGIDSITDT
ncbi:MAG: ribonuclease HI [Rickettsiales bacterium]|jgi:ribonuclease HI|nr:ribonuclease HI [Rickettsiales bacterium]